MMWSDIRRTYRSLIQRPTFFLAVVGKMALGIGANSAIFSVIDAVLLKPLPYPGGDRLMAVYESSPRLKQARSQVAPGRLEEWNRMNATFVGLAGAYTENQADTSGPLPEKLVCAKTSPRFFSVLGTPPLAGRHFNNARASRSMNVDDQYYLPATCATAAWSLRASALFAASQVKVSSVRPKWPKAAVLR